MLGAGLDVLGGELRVDRGDFSLTRRRVPGRLSIPAMAPPIAATRSAQSVASASTKPSRLPKWWWKLPLVEPTRLHTASIVTTRGSPSAMRSRAAAK